MIPLLPVRAADTPEMWSRVPTLADQANRGVPKQQLGMPQVLPHQGDILQLDVARAAEAAAPIRTADAASRPVLKMLCTATRTVPMKEVW